MRLWVGVAGIFDDFLLKTCADRVQLHGIYLPTRYSKIYVATHDIINAKPQRISVARLVKKKTPPTEKPSFFATLQKINKPHSSNAAQSDRRTPP